MVQDHINAYAHQVILIMEAVKLANVIVKYFYLENAIFNVNHAMVQEAINALLVLLMLNIGN